MSRKLLEKAAFFKEFLAENEVSASLSMLTSCQARCYSHSGVAWAMPSSLLVEVLDPTTQNNPH